MGLFNTIPVRSSFNQYIVSRPIILIFMALYIVIENWAASAVVLVLGISVKTFERKFYSGGL
jgi:hypothetical protein